MNYSMDVFMYKGVVMSYVLFFIFNNVVDFMKF